MTIYRLENVIQNYEWGSYTHIASLLNKSCPSLLPQAELWMGAHSKASSDVIINSNKYSLRQMIKNDPINVLGEQAFKNFGAKLPYLFKVLAIRKPLSIQVHPNKKQAISGYNRENHEQKSINSLKRNYKDQNHKVECMCALTPLWSMNGFRNIYEIQSLISMICPKILSKIFKIFLKEPNEVGLKNFFIRLFSLSKKEIDLIVSRALLKANRLKKKFLFLNGFVV